MAVLQTSDLKAHAGEILDAARHSPQYIFRDGQLFMLSPVEPGDAISNLPEGWFNQCYAKRPKVRLDLEEASARVDVGSEERQ